MGWELRANVGDTFARSQVCKVEADVYRVAEEWRAEAIEKGWKES
jgi:hypothetical protein